MGMDQLTMLPPSIMLLQLIMPQLSTPPSIMPLPLTMPPLSMPHLLTMPLSSMPPQLTTPLSSMPPQLTMPLPIPMSPPLTLTPMLLPMTTPTPTSTLLRLVMVTEMLRDLTLLLFLMAVPSMLTTRLMVMLDMLLMLPMMELLSTQMPQHLTMLPQSPPTPGNKADKERGINIVKNKRQKRDNTKITLQQFGRSRLKTNFTYLFIFIY